jgi:DNA-binding NtrC family response regulator
LPPGFGGTPAPLPVSSGSDLRIPVGYTIEQAERALIELTLEHTKNNKTRAAEILGISQKTLFNKLKEYGAQGASAD